jgi:hypothetical protein
VPDIKPPVTPLAPDRYQFTFTGSRETRELLELARDLLRHAVPGGDTGEIMNRALKALVRELERKKFAVTERPRKSRGPRDPQDPSAAVKRDVFVRDDGRCRYVAPSGRRCNERAFAERHHVVARGKGGKGTAGNMGMRCRNHNQYEAERDFGERRPGGEWDTRDRPAAYRETTRSGTSSQSPPASPPLQSPM